MLFFQGEFEDEEFNTPFTSDNDGRLTCHTYVFKGWMTIHVSDDSRRYVDDEDSGANNNLLVTTLMYNLYVLYVCRLVICYE